MILDASVGQDPLLRQRLAFALGAWRSTWLNNLVFAAVLALLLQPVIQPIALAWWILSVFVVNSGRMFIGWKYEKNGQPASRYWYLIYAVSTLASAVVWSAGSMILFPESSAKHQLYMIIVIGIIAHGASYHHSSSPRLMAVYLLILIPPSAIKILLSSNDQIDMTLKLIGTLILLVLASSAKRMCRTQIETMQLKEALRKMANIDSLTSIANRRAFDESLQKGWHQAKHRLQPYSVILLDIDHFKLYNDYLGHVNGDRALKLVAGAIRDSLERATDQVARYGGEEFAVLLPNTDAKGAKIIAEKIRNKIVGLKLEHKKSPTSNFITLSVGIATREQICSNMHCRQLVEEADSALYYAKSSGRNCSISYPQQFSRSA